jgi:hypothetical protein
MGMKESFLHAKQRQFEKQSPPTTREHITATRVVSADLRFYTQCIHLPSPVPVLTGASCT